MTYPRDTFVNKLWFLIVIILAAANLVLLSFHLSTTEASGASPTARFLEFSGNSESLAGRVGLLGNKTGDAMASTGRAISSSAESVATAAVGAGRSVQAGATAAGRSLVSGFAATARTAGRMAGAVSSMNVASSFIRPIDKTPVPVIIPAASAIPAVQTTPATSPAAPQTNAAPQWPLHGVITTQFGVPELPYERVHTGLDISDGRTSGVTPIKPFKPGVVSAVIRSNLGLGNHVIVDHGGGMTSVYGHLYSIAVQTGQPVDADTALGYEGSTGVSTGTHLHFEIRLNGQPVDPQKFISGRP